MSHIMDDGHMGDHELEDRKRIVTVRSEHGGPTIVRSSGAARRISQESVKHPKAAK
jgi:hypothetical protein